MNKGIDIIDYIAEHSTGKDRSFMLGYVEALLWSNNVGEDKEAALYTHCCSLALCSRAAVDCLDFLAQCQAKIVAVVVATDGRYSWEHAGHDLALTRNNHGAGYWDRGLGMVGEALTEAAENMGSIDVYLGDDGLLYDS